MLHCPTSWISTYIKPEGPYAFCVYSIRVNGLSHGNKRFVITDYLWPCSADWPYFYIRNRTKMYTFQEIQSAKDADRVHAGTSFDLQTYHDGEFGPGDEDPNQGRQERWPHRQGCHQEVWRVQADCQCIMRRCRTNGTVRQTMVLREQSGLLRIKSVSVRWSGARGTDVFMNVPPARWVWRRTQSGSWCRMPTSSPSCSCTGTWSLVSRRRSGKRGESEHRQATGPNETNAANCSRPWLCTLCVEDLSKQHVRPKLLELKRRPAAPSGGRLCSPRNWPPGLTWLLDMSKGDWSELEPTWRLISPRGYGLMRPEQVFMVLMAEWSTVKCLVENGGNREVVASCLGLSSLEALQ